MITEPGLGYRFRFRFRLIAARYNGSSSAGLSLWRHLGECDGIADLTKRRPQARAVGLPGRAALPVSVLMGSWLLVGVVEAAGCGEAGVVADHLGVVRGVQAGVGGFAV